MSRFNYTSWSSYLDLNDEKVDLSGLHFTIDDMTLVFQRLEQMPNLKILHIDNSNMTSAHLFHLSKIKGTLEQLSLAGIDPFVMSITSVVPFQDMTNLKFLDLSTNNITDVTPLTQLVNLRVLLLNDNCQLADLAPLLNFTPRENGCYLTSLSRLGLNNTLVKQNNNIPEELKARAGGNDMMLSDVSAAHGDNGGNMKSLTFTYGTDAEHAKEENYRKSKGETKTASDGPIPDIKQLFQSFFHNQTTNDNMDTFFCDEETSMNVLHLISKRFIEYDSSSVIKVILPSFESNPILFPTSVLNRWPWVTTMAIHSQPPGTVHMESTPCDSPQALLSLIEHLFGGSTILIRSSFENMLFGMDCASFFEIPSLTSIVIESLQIELDMENVCDVLSRMTLAQSPLRARCMQLYMENPDVFAQHCHEQRLRPTLQREIYALKKALSETTASDWKFSKESYPSSYKEMLSIMRDSVKDQERVLLEKKQEVLNGNFIDGAGQVVPWNSPLMKQTRERFEDQEVDIQTKRSFVQGHERLFERIMTSGDQEVSVLDEDSTTTKLTLRQISNEGRNILREALAGKFNAKAKLIAEREYNTRNQIELQRILYDGLD